jgi:hypothetical protein
MTDTTPQETRLIVRDDGQEWQRIVMAEVLIPDVPNCYGDISTRAGIRGFMEAYALRGYIIDVEHDLVDVTNQKAYVVESFIARPGDPDFVEGSWVVSMKIVDDDLWADVLAGRINGYSYQARVEMFPVLFQHFRPRVVSGVTSPDPVDGHTHTYTVVLNAINRPITGGTSETQGHAHTITSHTVTDSAKNGLFGAEHVHRYQVLHIEDAPDEQ